MEVGGIVGQVIRIEATRDFKHWEAIATLKSRSGHQDFIDEAASQLKARFYRAVTEHKPSNCVGFINVELPPGSSLFSNALDCGSNQIGSLLPAMPEGTFLKRLNMATQAFTENEFTQGSWRNPADCLNPGDGAIIFNPSSRPITVRIAGQVLSETQSSFPSGSALLGSRLPICGSVDSDLGFPIAPGDSVHLYSNHNEKYLSFEYGENGWVGGVPLVRLGEAFWVHRKASATWRQALVD